MRSPPMKENAVIVTADLLHRVPTVMAFGLLAVAALHDIGFRTLPDTVSIALLGCGLAVHGRPGGADALAVAM